MIAKLSRDLRQRRPGLMRVLDSTAWLALDRLVRMGFGLIVGVWIARHLGPADFGELSFAIVFVGLFGVVAKFGLDRIVVRDLVRSPDDAEEILGSAMALRIVGGLIVFTITLAAIWALRPGDRQARVLVAVIGLGMVADTCDTIDQFFQAKVAVKYTVWARNGALVLASIVRIALIKTDAPLVAFAWAQLGEAMVASVALLAINGRAGIPVTKWKASTARAWSLLGESWPQILSAMAISIYMRIDVVMLEEMKGKPEAGIYSAATRLSELWYFIPMTVLTTVFPSVIRAREHNPALYQRRMLSLFSLMSALSLTLAVPIALLAGPLVHLVYGTQYAQSAPVLTVHIWSSLFVFLGTAQESWNVAEGLMKLNLYRTLAGAVINVVLNLVLIPRYGSLGAAWATVIAYAFAAVFGNLFSARTRPIFVLQVKSLLFPKYLFVRP